MSRNKPTRKQAVLNVLWAARNTGYIVDHSDPTRPMPRPVPDGWVDGHFLCRPGIGGSEGLRRVRELREDDGYDIEKRNHPEKGRQTAQYRLVDPS